jgi:hypothetical protein
VVLVRKVVRGVYMHFGQVVTKERAVAESMTRMKDEPDLLHAAAEIGVGTLFGEIERKRRPSGLREGERAVSEKGEQLSLPLLDMTFSQAREVNAKKYTHAQGSLVEARFEAKLIDLAAERARERGIDPTATEMVIGQFIDEDEIAALRKAA